MSQYTEELQKQNKRVKWCIKGMEDLTDWEQSFIESIESQSDRGKWLSDRQMEIFEKIYREKGQ